MKRLKKLIVIAMLSIMTLTSGCALFNGYTGKRATSWNLQIMGGNSFTVTTTSDGTYPIWYTPKDVKAIDTVKTDSGLAK